MSDCALVHQLTSVACRGGQQKLSNFSDKRLRSLRRASSRGQMQTQKLHHQQSRGLLTRGMKRAVGRRVSHLSNPTVAIRIQRAFALMLPGELRSQKVHTSRSAARCLGIRIEQQAVHQHLVSVKEVSYSKFQSLQVPLPSAACVVLFVGPCKAASNLCKSFTC